MQETSPIVDGLSGIHKIITQGLTTSVSKCDEYISKEVVTSGETEGFSLYLTTLMKVMHSHHLSEDDIAFPYFKSKIEAPFDQLENDHQGMARILDMLGMCIMDLSLGGIHKLQKVLNTLNELWVPHIKIEEENFTMEKLNAVAELKEQAALTKRLSAHSIKNSGPGALAVPFLFYNLEGKDREAFMIHFPWIVKKVLVPIIWRGKWKPMRLFLK